MSDIEQALVIYDGKNEIPFCDLVYGALKKQVPRKPKLLKYQPLLNAGWEWECPACGLAVGKNKNDIDVTQEDPYCPSCGQSLKWGDSDV
jgi:hypothetical protein